jgi:hypothetical protein
MNLTGPGRNVQGHHLEHGLQRAPPHPGALYSGKIVEAEITAITNQSTGRKLQIVYGNVTASINPAQVTEVLASE